MSEYCLLDQLPVELLHTLFDYFSVWNLLYTFNHVSDYVDATLRSYSSYQVDCRAVSKYYFRCIRDHVRAEQIISLTLSDEDNTPGFSDLFFSCFPIEQFIRLRLLTLIKVECNSLKYIFANLHKLDQLRVFSFDDQSIRYQYPSQDKSVPSYLTDVNIHVLSQVNHLYLNNATMLTSIPFPHLRYLNVRQCSNDELQTIFQHAPQLKSLNVWLNLHSSNFEFVLPPNQLTQLDLAITSKCVRFERKHSSLRD
jgi:hypothetical protein